MVANTPAIADSTGRLCLWALHHALRRWTALLAVLAAMLAKIGLDVLKPWPMLFLVDNILGGKPMPAPVATLVGWLPGPARAETLITWCVVATVILFLLAWALGVATAYANIAFGQRMIYDLAADLFACLQRLSLRYHSRKSVGDSIRRVTSDCNCVATIVRDAQLPVLASVVSLGMMFAIMWRMDATLTLLSLLVLPCMIAIFRRYAGPMLQRSYEQQEVEGRMYDVVEQTLYAIPVVQAFVREDQADERFRASTRASIDAALVTTTVQLKFKVLMGLTTALGTAAIIWIGTLHALEQRLTTGSILVFLSYLASLYGPLESLMYTTSTIHQAAGSARRVLEILTTQREVADRPGALLLPTVRGHIRFEGVTFGYDRGRPVLQEISLEVLPGQTIGVVGATGAGKTTLVSLVPRFFDPWEGRVFVDGLDMRDVQVKSLRRQIALVLQEPFLFPITIAQNIAYGCPDASPEQIEAAAHAANFHDCVQRLPEGYNTRVGERGATLSGGERQRLSIARAFLKNAPLLILDEPTSALDTETEALLLAALRRLMKGRTTFIIAHRLSIVRDADVIVVLHDGRVAEKGYHEELLARGGRYAYLYELQQGSLVGSARRDGS